MNAQTILCVLLALFVISSAHPHPKERQKRHTRIRNFPRLLGRTLDDEDENKSSTEDEDSAKDGKATGLLDIGAKISEEEKSDTHTDTRKSVPFAEPNSLTFPCAPPGITSVDYITWTDFQKLQFGVCFESNLTLIEEIKNRTLQAKPEDPCHNGEVTWNHIMPLSLNDIDFHNEFHEEVSVPNEYLVENVKDEISNISARVLNAIGFAYLYQILTSGEPVCDVLRNDQLPIECFASKCICKDLILNEGNDYILHYTAFRDQRKPPIGLEYNNPLGKCTFKDGQECTVQPNEGKAGNNPYFIPCSNDRQQCVISGNDVLCTRKNMSRTIEAYNDFAYKIKSPMKPFRMYYPINCICTEREVVKEVPKLGFERSVYVESFGLDEDYDKYEDGSEDSEAPGPQSSLATIAISVMFSIWLMIKH